MKYFFRKLLRSCLVIYTIVTIGASIITKTTKTTTTTTKTTTMIMTIETTSTNNNKNKNNCQANLKCCYKQQQNKSENSSERKYMKLAKREIDERLIQKPKHFTIMHRMQEKELAQEMEPENEQEATKNVQQNSYDSVDYENDDNVDDDDDDDDGNSFEEDKENIDVDSNDNQDEEEDDGDDDELDISNEYDGEIKGNKKKKSKKKKKKRRKVQKGNKKRKRRKYHGTVSPLGQPANLLLASLTQLPTIAPPLSQYHHYKPHKIKITTPIPKMKPIKYLLHKGNLLK